MAINRKKVTNKVKITYVDWARLRLPGLYWGCILIAVFETAFATGIGWVILFRETFCCGIVRRSTEKKSNIFIIFRKFHKVKPNSWNKLMPNANQLKLNYKWNLFFVGNSNIPFVGSSADIKSTRRDFNASNTFLCNSADILVSPK